jgi:hypothetical protein
MEAREGKLSHRKTPAELWIALRDQVAALRSSSQGFDNGHPWEAGRLASIVYILVHDAGRTVSLLTQLKRRETVRFPSTRTIGSDTSQPQTPLVFIAAEIGKAKASYQPLLGREPIPPELLPFSKWWEQPVLRDSSRRSVSRKNLVFSLRSQDGGAHVDGTLTDEAYVALSLFNGAGWFFSDGESEQPFKPGPHLATMRQIAWEVDCALEGVAEVGNAR